MHECAADIYVVGTYLYTLPTFLTYLPGVL